MSRTSATGALVEIRGGRDEKAVEKIGICVIVIAPNMIVGTEKMAVLTRVKTRATIPTDDQMEEVDPLRTEDIGPVPEIDTVLRKNLAQAPGDEKMVTKSIQDVILSGTENTVAVAVAVHEVGVGVILERRSPRERNQRILLGKIAILRRNTGARRSRNRSEGSLQVERNQLATRILLEKGIGHHRSQIGINVPPHLPETIVIGAPVLVNPTREIITHRKSGIGILASMSMTKARVVSNLSSTNEGRRSVRTSEERWSGRTSDGTRMVGLANVHDRLHGVTAGQLTESRITNSMIEEVLLNTMAAADIINLMIAVMGAEMDLSCITDLTNISVIAAGTILPAQSLQQHLIHVVIPSLFPTIEGYQSLAIPIRLTLISHLRLVNNNFPLPKHRLPQLLLCHLLPLLNQSPLPCHHQSQPPSQILSNLLRKS